MLSLINLFLKFYFYNIGLEIKKKFKSKMFIFGYFYGNEIVKKKF